MTHPVFDTPLEAQIIDSQVVITGPDGFNGSMTIEAAKRTVENLRRALGEDGEPYQKPLG